MLPLLSVSASLLNLLLILTLLLPRKIIFKLNWVLNLWLVCTTFFAIILLHLRIHSLKKYSRIFLYVSSPIYSIILSMNTPRMMNQSILLTHQFLHFVPTIQPIFPKYFYIFLIFFCNSKILTKRTGTGRYKKGRRPRTTDDLHLPSAGYPTSQKPPLLARSFNRSLHSAADHSSICRRN